MKEITLNLRGVWLEPTWAVAGTRGSRGCSVLKLGFSSDWDGLRRRVTFFPADGSEAVEVYENDGEVMIPDEVMNCAGSAGFVIDGEREGACLVSQRGELRVIDTARPGGRQPAYLAEITALREEVRKLKERCENGITVF
jgi:hypothetical protein